MTLTEFINTTIEKYGYDYDCYELGKTTPYENSNLIGLELQYLMEGYIVYTKKSMDSDYQTYTYIFKNGDLSLKIRYDNPSHQKTLYFYKENQLEKNINEYY